MLASTTLVPVRTLSGAALAIGRTALEEVGGWDEAYFLYSEDTDLCVRARRMGFPVLYAPYVSIVHRGERSARQNPDAVAMARRAGWDRFKQIHYGVLSRGLVCIATGVSRRLPRLRDRWQAATPMDLARPLDLRAARSRGRVAVELARSPLFDNGLTAFPDQDTLILPSGLRRWLPPGTCFLRTAIKGDDGRWLEASLARLNVPIQAETPDKASS